MSFAQIVLVPPQVKDGGVLRVRVAGTKPSNIIFEDRTYPVYTVGEEFEALIGIPFGYKKGTATLKVDGTQTSFEVIDGEYPSEKLKVDPKHVRLKKRDLARVKRESAEVGKLYKIHSGERLWSGNFGLPVESPFTSVFGSKRIYNGEMQSFHQGLDLKAAVGTPIFAPEKGTVVYSKNMFMTGNTVILDHGLGVFTIYAHLSAAQVRRGQKLERGAKVGLAGATGRASGPHLHWGAVIMGVKVNPLDLTQVLAGGK